VGRCEGIDSLEAVSLFAGYAAAETVTSFVISVEEYDASFFRWVLRKSVAILGLSQLL